MIPPAAVLFDMDGTLIDTEPLWLLGETQTMSSFGYTWTAQDQQNCFGLPIPIVSAYMHERVPQVAREHIVESLLDTMDNLMSTRFAWSPGADQLLQEVLAAALPCALVSASWRRLVDVNLQQMSRSLGVDAFDVSIAGDEVQRGKPDPEPYLRAAARLGVDARTCLIVEDSPAGVAAALATGARVVGIEHLVPLGEHERLHIVPSLAGVRLTQLC